MGREVKRVAMGFDWPVNKIWQGFVNPFDSKRVKCEACDGSGYSDISRMLQARWYGNAPFRPEERGSVPFAPDHPAVMAFARRNVERGRGYYGLSEDPVWREAKRLAELFNSRWSHHLNEGDVDALIRENRLMDFTHQWTKGKGWIKRDPPIVPTPLEVNVWSLSGIGHDSINCSVVVDAECVRLGVSNICAVCGGDGGLWPCEQDRLDYEAWEPTQPPAGDGWQIWETVSEGSPLSPVFATPEELAAHMAGTTWGADKGTPYETWLTFIRGPGWSVSMVMDEKGVRDGVTAAVDNEGG